ncbi:hypothetical protein F0562_022357 [Nyssa sinensis]|uniref:DUF4220 domain-containing protein n=1 Tax=Nyssa sinensis TaxID=561372 RepID=A0A5J5BMM9_9ASTE|nr:hypothetical protein F0562_022357 [Nyssa sinensis]
MFHSNPWQVDAKSICHCQSKHDTCKTNNTELVWIATAKMIYSIEELEKFSLTHSASYSLSLSLSESLQISLSHSLQHCNTVDFAVLVIRCFHFLEKIKMEIFSESLRRLWNEWEIRGMVLLSLLLQVLLICLGSQRKYNRRKWIRFSVWLAYLSADWIATVALGVLASSQGDSTDGSQDPNYVISAFWAPFLLLHLGGPDTITAYALEDNELWLRHLLGLIVQVAVALYVFVRSLKPTELNFVAIPIFIAGIIKYGERTWALRSASNKYFRKSIIEVGVGQARREAAGDFATRINIPRHHTYILDTAYDFFHRDKEVFANLMLSTEDLVRSYQETFGYDPFEVIEIELGLVYDVFYTKAVIVYSRWGCFLRCVSLSSTIAAFWAFCVIKRLAYSSVDVGIAFLLLGGAISLEIYAIIVMLSSDWTKLWLIKSDNSVVRQIVCKFVSGFKCMTRNNERWSNSMGQYSILGSCFKSKAAKYGEGITFEDIPSNLKSDIFSQLADKLAGTFDITAWKQLSACRGDQVLRERNCIDKLGWSVQVDFDRSILLWHIATDICYQHDSRYGHHPNREVSKLLSNDLMYILAKLPVTFPNKIMVPTLQDIYDQAMEFPGMKNRIIYESKAQDSKSELYDALRIVQSLQSLETEQQWEIPRKWEMISQVWIEMLSYAAIQSKWNQHAQQLRRGGEFLTHVWLLMTHLGITDQLQMSQQKYELYIGNLISHLNSKTEVKKSFVDCF